MAVWLLSIDDYLVNVGGYPSLTGTRRFTAVDDELVRVYRNSSGSRVGSTSAITIARKTVGREQTGDAGAALALAASPLTLTTESQRIVSDSYHLKSYTIWDAVTRRRTNGAVVMIAWDDAAGAQSETARKHAIEFARALLPVLRRHLPVQTIEIHRLTRKRWLPTSEAGTTSSSRVTSTFSKIRGGNPFLPSGLRTS